MSSGMVDTKTVEMRFDNQDFERNCKQSISTLDKLKAALKLDGASKGLADIEKSAKKLDMKDLRNNVESVGNKFSALETIATGVFLRIGMAAADAGAKIVKSLTIDQLTSGWNKYEEKTTAVQTIMANLRDTTGKFVDEADKMDYVNEQIDRLNWFSDETSYSLTDMTNNIGKFVANGQNLEDSVVAMEGIATWAAISGQNSQTAARAMYNISQAMGVGAMKVMDWKSIENANMATAEFKETAIAIAEQQGKIKKGKVTIENFRESLSKNFGKKTKNGWFDKEVMMETFKEYGSAVERVIEKQEQVAKANDGLYITASKALQMLGEEDEEFSKTLGYRAFKAAQEAKTFHEALSATADAVSTKWMSVFENIFGNYLEQRTLWTDLANDLWDVFAGPVDNLNNIFASWNKGIDGISGRTHLIKGFKNIFDTLVHSVMDPKTGKISRYSIFDTIKNGFKSVFGLDKTADELGKRLWKLTEKFQKFTESLIPSPETLAKIQNSFEGFFTIFKIFGKTISAVIKPFKKLFKDEFPNGLKSLLDLSDSFATFIKNFDKFLDESGVFETVSNYISLGFKKIGEAADWLSLKISGLTFKDFLKKTKLKVTDFFKNFDFKSGFEKIGNFFRGIVDQLRIVNTEDLPEKLTPLQNFYLGLVKIFTGIKSFFAAISPAFKFIGDKINQFLTSIGEAFKNREINKAPSKFQPIFDGIKSIFAGIGEFFVSIGPTLKKVGAWIGEALGSLGKAIAKFTENKSAIEIFESIAKGGFFIALTNFINSIAGLNKGGKGILDGIAGGLKAVKGVLKAYQREINVSTLLELAMAIGVLAASMWVLSKIPADRLHSVGQALAQIALVIAAFSVAKDIIKWLTKFNNSKEGNDPDSLFGKFKSIFTGMVSASIFANDASAKFLKVAAGILFAAIAAKKVAEAVEVMGAALVKLGKEDESAIKKGGKIVGQIIGVFGVFALLSGFANKTMSALAAALAAVIVIKAVAKLINLMAELGGDSKKLANIKKFFDTFSGTLKDFGDFILKFVAIVAIAEVLMAIASASSLTPGLAKVLKQFGNNFLKIAASLAVVAAAVWMISKTEYTQGDIANCAIIFGGFIALVGLLQALMAKVSNSRTGMVGALPGILKQFGNNFLKIAASLLIVAKAVKMIAETPYQSADIWNCAFIFGGFIALVGLAQYFMAKVANSKAAMTQGQPVARILKIFGNNFLKIAASLLIVAWAVKICAGIDFGEDGAKQVRSIFLGFLAIVGAVAVLAIALSALKSASVAKIVAAMASIAALLLAAAGSLFLVTMAVEQMQGLKLSNAEAIKIGAIFGGFIALVGLMGVLAGALTNNWSGTAAILALAASYIAAAFSLMLLAEAFGKMQGLKNLLGITVIFGAFLGLVGAIGILAGEMVTNWSGVAAMAVMAASYIAAAYALQLLAAAFNSMMDVANSNNIWQIAGIFGLFLVAVGAFGLLAGLVATDWTAVAGMGMMLLSYIVAAYSLQILAEAMNTMCQITNPSQLQTACDVMSTFLVLVMLLALIGGALGAFGGKDAILGMAAIAGIIASIGIACLAAGAGIGLCAAALAELVEAIAIYGPEAAANIRQLLDALLDAVIATAPKMAVAAVAVISALAIGLIGSAPIVAQAALIVLVTLLDTLANNIPILVNAIVNLIAAAIHGIATAIRAASTVILPAVADVLSAIIELNLEVLAELVELIPGFGSSIAGKIRGWKGEINEAVTGAFSDVKTIAAEGAESAVDGFSGGGSGKSFAQAGTDSGTELISSTKAALAPASSVGEKAATDVSGGFTTGMAGFDVTSLMGGKMAELLASVNTGGDEATSSFSDMFAAFKTSGEDFDVTSLMDGKMSDFLASITSGGDEASTSFSGILDSLGLSLNDWPLGDSTSTKMSEMTTAIQEEKEPATSAATEITTSVESKVTSLDSKSWGKDLVAAYAAGIEAGKPKAVAAANAIAAAVKAVLHFSEPDEGPLSDFHTYAPDMIKLWCKGVYDNLDMVENSSESIADTVNDGFTNALNYVSDLIDNGMTDELSIRPVMDLSEIQNGMQRLDSMIGRADGYSLYGTAKLATSAAYGVNSRMSADSEPVVNSTNVPVNNYNTFNISNNDPEAVAQKVSKLIGQETKRVQAVWAR